MATNKNTVNVNSNESVLAKKENEKKPLTIKDLIKSYEGQFAKALPSVMTAERFARIATTALTQNPALKQCSPASFMGALLTSAQLGLEPNTPLGHCYIIPYKSSERGLEATFQIGYKGLIDLAHRSGDLKSIEAHIVYEKDIFEFEYGLEPKLKHIPTTEPNKGEIVWVYAIYHLVNGGYGFEVMSKADINYHRNKFSKAKNSPAWKNSWDEMAKKTVIKKALKYAPLKSEFAKAINSDETTLNAVVTDDEQEMDIVQAPYEVVDADEEEKAETVDKETGEIKKEK